MNPKGKKISDLIKRLQELKKKHGDLYLVTSSDDEGNWFQQVWFDAGAGYFTEGQYFHYGEGEGTIQEQADDPDAVINCVCIN